MTAVQQWQFPSNLLSWISGRLSFGNPHMPCEIGPVNPFPEIRIRLKLEQFPYASGKFPVKLLLNNMSLEIHNRGSSS